MRFSTTTICLRLVVRSTVAALATVWLVSCGGGGDEGRFAYNISLVGLQDSNTVEGHYEGWAVVGNVAFTTGKFVVVGTGPNALVMNPQRTRTFGIASAAEFGPSITLLGTSFPSITEATHLFITLEPEGDNNRIPSCQVLLAGAIVGETATLTPEGVAVPSDFPCAVDDGAGGFRIGLGDFSSAAGVFQLRTPTDDPTQTANDFGGVWFVTTAGLPPGSFGAGLSLPPLPGSLVYEGWAVVDGVTQSLGRFQAPTGRDSDFAVAPQRGNDSPGPDFPGQDFVTSVVPTEAFDPPELDLTASILSPTGDFRTFISVEPVPDNDVAPFQLVVLDGAIPVDAVNANQVRVMDVVLDTEVLPEAAATLTTSSVTLNDLGLISLGAGTTDRRGHFELWVTVAGTPASAGRFLVDGVDVYSLDTAQVIGSTAAVTFTSANTGISPFPDAGSATECFITFEDEADADGSPSDRVFLQGDVAGGAAALTVVGAVETGGRGLADLDIASGSCTLASPTNDLIAPADDNRGILFRTLSAGPSLVLPPLPEVWRYEAFVVDLASGRIFSTGKFRLSIGADENDSISASRGPNAKPGFPGEDFLVAVPTELLNAAVSGSITEVFVTIETDPDNGVGPSQLRLLEAAVPPGAATATDLALTLVAPQATTLFAQMSFEAE